MRIKMQMCTVTLFHHWLCNKYRTTLSGFTATNAVEANFDDRTDKRRTI